MKFSIGDIVKLIHTGQEGKIVGVENKFMYQVEVGGVVFPVFKEHIEHPYFDWFTNDKEKKKKLKTITVDQLPKEENNNEFKIEQGLYLSFFPVFNEKNIDEILKFKIYLINENNYNVFFEYKLINNQESVFKLKGMIYPFANFYVHNIDFELMQEIPEFTLNYGREGTNDYTKVIKLKAPKIMSFVSSLLNGEIPYFSILIDKNVLELKKDTNQKINLKPIDAPTKFNSKKVLDYIDLHFEALGLEHYSIKLNEILDLQLKALHNYFDSIEESHFDSVTIIHGVGEGILKQKVHEFLRSHRLVRHFIAEWMPKYGNGATQVFLYK